MHREEEEGRRAVEHQPRDAEPPRDVRRVRAARVGDDAVRPPRQRAEVRLERLGEQGHGVAEEPEMRVVPDHVVALAPLGQAQRGSRELELGEVDGEPGAAGVLQDGPVARGVDGGQDDGDARAAAAAGDEARHVHHGDDVALREERHQHEVELERQCRHGRAVRTARHRAQLQRWMCTRLVRET
uniref:Uncharacterized protein n=1 Tax=Triticum urartu TaxID=4572 RepID=A0A8R7JXE2_TRIUA